MSRHGTRPGRTAKPRYQRGAPAREESRWRRSLAEWRLALRIARRSVWRSRGTSIIVALMVLLPVAGFSAAAVILQSSMPTPHEKVAAELGQNEAKLTPVAGPDSHARQDPFNADYLDSDVSHSGPPEPLDEEGVRALFPADTRLISITMSDLVAETADGIAPFPVTIGPLWDASFHGRTHIVEGYAPESGTDVLVSASALDHLGARVGDSIRITAPEPATVTITGVLDDAKARDAVEQIYLPDGDVASTLTGDGRSEYFLPATVFAMSDLPRLNHAGVTALSREILSHATFVDLAASSGVLQTFGIFMAMAAAFAAFEVILLAGAAFAVGARKQQRALATMASVGADKRMLRRIVLSQGVVLGALGGLAGLALGVPAAALTMKVTSDGSATQYWGFHAQPLVLFGIFVLAVAVGLASAVVPARSAAKFDVLAALRGSRKPATPSRSAPRFGLALIITGAAATILTAFTLPALMWNEHPTLKAALLATMIAGPLLVQIGAIMCGGLILRTVSRLVSRASLGARMATRDSAANTRRSVPAFASVMVTAFLAAVVICVGTVQVSQMNAYYTYAALPGQATVFAPHNLDGSIQTRIDDVEALVEHDLPSATVARYSEPEFTLDPDTGQYIDGQHVTVRVPADHVCPNNPSSPDFDPEIWEDPSSAMRESQRLTASDPRCSTQSTMITSNWNSIVVTDSNGLAVWLGGAVPDAVRTAFENRSVVTSTPLLVNDGGTLTLDWWAADGGPTAASSQQPDQEPLREETIAAVAAAAPFPINERVVMSEDTAQSLGIPVQISHLLAAPGDEGFAQAQIDALEADLSAVGSGVFVEHGPDKTWFYIIAAILLIAGVLFICASAIAIGLARADGRADDATLAAIGATQMLRRSFSFWQALVLVGLGTLVGAGAGLPVSYSLRVAGAFSSGPFEPPWTELAILVIGMPLVIALGSWLVASKPVALVRRDAIG